MNRETKILLGFALAFILLFIIFYPSAPQMSDESEYFRNVHLLLQGKTAVDKPELAYNYVSNEGRFFSRYPTSAALFLAPFALLGIKGVFIFGLFFFFLGAYFFVKLLDFHKLSRIWGLFYFAYTPFLFHATTLMNDLPSAALVTGAFYLFLRKKHALSGALFGLATLLKVTNLFGLLLLCTIGAYDFLRKREKLTPFITLGLAAAPFVLLLFAHNWYLYGGPLASGYGFMHNNAQFLFGNPDYPIPALSNFFHYLGFLLLFYPAMPILAAIPRYNFKRETLLYAAFLVLFFANNNNLLKFTPDDLIIHYRLIFPAVPLLMIGYAHFWQKTALTLKLSRYIVPLFMVAASISLVLFVPVLDLKAQGSARTLAITQDLYSHTENGSLLIGVQEGNYLNEYFGERAYISTLRPLGYNEPEQLLAQKVPEYLALGKVYLIELDTPYYSYKRNFSSSQEILQRVREQHQVREVFKRDYNIHNFYYNNTITLTLHELT